MDLANPEVVAAARDEALLRIESGALAAGGRYRFRLEATDCAGAGSAELEVQVNAPPREGQCRVTSADLIGWFTLTCEGFEDPDLPLAYSVWIEAPGQRPEPIAGPSPEAVRELQLPPGEYGLLVFVADALGLDTQVHVPVVVRARNPNP